MNYANWEIKTCLNHRVLLEGWPEEVPYSPKSIKIFNLPSVQDGLTHGTIKYRRMTDEEYERAKAAANSS